MESDRDLDIIILEIQLENEQLIRDYLEYVMRERDKQPQEAQALPEENPYAV